MVAIHGQNLAGDPGGVFHFFCRMRNRHASSSGDARRRSRISRRDSHFQGFAHEPQSLTERKAGLWRLVRVRLIHILLPRPYVLAERMG